MMLSMDDPIANKKCELKLDEVLAKQATITSPLCTRQDENSQMNRVIHLRQGARAKRFPKRSGFVFRHCKLASMSFLRL